MPGHNYYSVALITQQAAHLRRPIILNQQQQQLWLDPESSDEQLREVLASTEQPQPHERRVSTLITDPLVDGPHCLNAG